MQPVHAYSQANAPVVLYEGDLSFATTGVRQGRIELVCQPKPRVRWTIVPQAGDDGLDPSPVDFAVRRDNREFRISGYRRSREDGWINSAEFGKPDTALRQVRLHWMNLPDIHGPIGLVERDGDHVRRWWLGRWRIEVAGWLITLDSRPDHSDATTDADLGSLFLLTHAMEIRRADDGEFSVEKARQLLEHLRVTFSFAFGYWVSPVLPQGFDTEGRLVWEQWSSPICDPHRRVPTAWLYWGRPEDLTQLVSRAIPALADLSQPGTTRLQMQLAVTAVDGGFVEQRILAAAPALENLGWTRLVSGGKWTAAEYNGRYAEDRLRYLLQEARVPPNIDPDLFPALAAFAERDGLDGPSAVTRVRNRLVHPQLPEEVSRHEGLVQDVWRMLRRYVTLLILHNIGYRGSFVDPAKLTGWVGDTAPVPWAEGGTVLPPMPLDKRTIRENHRSGRSDGSSRPNRPRRQRRRVIEDERARTEPDLRDVEG
jgi:hypothetical protein